MSERDRSGNAALGLIAAVGVALVVVAFGLFLGQEKIYARDYADASEYKPSHADGYVKQCSEVPRDALAACVAENLEAEREGRQGRYDLRAQQDMSKWVLLTLFAAVAGLALTGAGIYFVAHNLIEARKATSAALRAAKATEDAGTVSRDIGQAQVRAYLSIPSLNIQFLGHAIKLSGQISNNGQSVARKVRVVATCTWMAGKFGESGPGRVDLEPISAQTSDPFDVEVQGHFGRIGGRQGEIEGPIGLPPNVTSVTATIQVTALDVFNESIDCVAKFKFVRTEGEDGRGPFPMARSNSRMVIVVADLRARDDRKRGRPKSAPKENPEGAIPRAPKPK